MVFFNFFRTVKNSLPLIAALIFGVVSSVVLHSQSAEAQSLEERVERLEKKLDESSKDHYPADPYVDEFGGRLMADWTFNTSERNYSTQLGDPAGDGFEVRRLRLHVKGSVAEDIAYKTELDFAGGKAKYNDIFLKFKDLGPLPYLKVGHFKGPFSLEELTSSKYITFMSRAALTAAFSRSYSPGVQTGYHTADEKLNFTFGAFNLGESKQAATSGGWDLSGRLTSPVLYRDGGEQLVHLGAAYSLRGEDGESLEVATKPEVHKGGPEMLEVDIPDLEHSAVTGLELATVLGPASLQAEWAQQSVDQTTGSSVDLDSYYAMASYFLTGESRPYDRAGGNFGRVDVRSPYRDGGFGALELAARFSSTDFTDAKDSTQVLTDGVVDDASSSVMKEDMAGQMDVLTVGTNWYPSSHSKVMLNYVDATQDDANVDAQWVTTRFQVDF